MMRHEENQHPDGSRAMDISGRKQLHLGCLTFIDLSEEVFTKNSYIYKSDLCWELIGKGEG